MSTTLPPLIVYSAAWCHDCQNLKAFLEAESIPHEVRDIIEHKPWGQELEAQTGKLGVPYLRMGEEWVIGYEPNVGYNEAYARDILADYLKANS